jgi:peroxiredoxin Q/BCP
MLKQLNNIAKYSIFHSIFHIDSGTRLSHKINKEIPMAHAISQHEKLPSLALQTTSETIKNTHDFLGKKLVLYFYPKDNTSGCSQQAQDFRDYYSQFLKENAEVIGVSRDSLLSHKKFIEKFNLPFPLISDPDETLCQLFDVMKKKKLYGKEYIGIERSTFLINEKGVLCNEWRNVKVEQHVKEVLDTVKNL